MMTLVVILKSGSKVFVSGVKKYKFERDQITQVVTNLEIEYDKLAEDRLVYINPTDISAIVEKPE